MKEQFKVFARRLAPFVVALIVLVILVVGIAYISGRVTESMLQNQIQLDIAYVATYTQLESVCPSHQLGMQLISLTATTSGILITCH